MPKNYKEKPNVSKKINTFILEICESFCDGKKIEQKDNLVELLGRKNINNLFQLINKKLGINIINIDILPVFVNKIP